MMFNKVEEDFMFDVMVGMMLKDMTNIICECLVEKYVELEDMWEAYESVNYDIETYCRQVETLKIDLIYLSDTEIVIEYIIDNRLHVTHALTLKDVGNSVLIEVEVSDNDDVEWYEDTDSVEDYTHLN